MEIEDEEKKAIIELNHFSNMTAYWKQEEYTNSEIDNYIKIVLNLIENQQKEIEELQAINQMQKYRIEVIDERELISKDKIKAKIEEIENYYKELYKQDNSPNEFLISQNCLSKLSILQEVKQSLLEEKE